jgi:hypothetical protein
VFKYSPEGTQNAQEATILFVGQRVVLEINRHENSLRGEPVLARGKEIPLIILRSEDETDNTNEESRTGKKETVEGTVKRVSPKKTAMQ